MPEQVPPFPAPTSGPDASWAVPESDRSLPAPSAAAFAPGPLPYTFDAGLVSNRGSVAGLSGPMQALSIVATLLGLAVWLLRVFVDVGDLRKLWVGAWRVDFPLLVVALALVIAAALTAARRTEGPGLAAGVLLATRSVTGLNNQIRPGSYQLARAIQPVAIVALGAVLIAVIRSTHGHRPQNAAIAAPVCLTLLLLVLGQFAAKSFGFPAFDLACYIGLAIGIGLANRAGWTLAFGSLLFSSARGAFLELARGGARLGSYPARKAEIVCGIALAIVCLILALRPTASSTTAPTTH